MYRAIALPYERIAEVFQSGNGDLLQEEFEAGRSLWRAVSCLVLDMLRCS